MEAFALCAILALTGPGASESIAREIIGMIPLVGGMLSDVASPTSAKAQPEPADMDLVERLIGEGVLVAHPCEWYVVRGEDG